MCQVSGLLGNHELGKLETEILFNQFHRVYHVGLPEAPLVLCKFWHNEESCVLFLKLARSRSHKNTKMRDECACVFVRVCVYHMIQKEDISK
jgi:hypothetical protein